MQGNILSVDSLYKTKRWRKCKSALSASAEASVSSCPWTSVINAFDSPVLGLRLGLIPPAPNSQPFRLSLNCTTDFPSSSACRLWEFHNHINHSYNKSLFYIFIFYIYIYIYIYISIYIYMFIPYGFCFSREPWLIQSLRALTQFPHDFTSYKACLRKLQPLLI